MTKKKKPIDFVNSELMSDNSSSEYKKANTNTALSTSKKTQTVQYEFDDLFRIFSFRDEPIKIDELALRMKKYALREADEKKGITEGWSVEGFCLENEYAYDSFMHLVGKYPRLAAAHKYMKQMLGERRDRGASRKTYDGNHIRATIGYYLPRYVEEQARLAELAADNPNNQNKVVVIESLTCGHIEGSK